LSTEAAKWSAARPHRCPDGPPPKADEIRDFESESGVIPVVNTIMTMMNEKISKEIQNHLSAGVPETCEGRQGHTVKGV